MEYILGGKFCDLTCARYRQRESGRGVWRELSESVWRRFESVKSNKALDHQEAWKQQSWIDTHVPFHARTSLCLEMLCF
jgi:hypothetical protein